MRGGQKSPKPPYPRPVSRQDEEPEVFESKEDGFEAAVGIHGFNASAYRRNDIWIIIGADRGGQHPLPDPDQAQAAELGASFRHHIEDYNNCPASVTPLKPAFKSFYPFDVLDSNKESGMLLHNYCHIGVLHLRHCIFALKSFLQSTNFGLESIFDKKRLRYISKEDEKLLWARKIFILP